MVLTRTGVWLKKVLSDSLTWSAPAAKPWTVTSNEKVSLTEMRGKA